MKRIFASSAVLIVLAAICFFALRPRTGSDAASGVTNNQLQLPPLRATGTAAEPATPPLERLDMAKDLNAPGKTIQEDLRALEGVFLSWQSNFLKEGNPVGDNREITAALTGQNSLHVAFLAPDHPAINADRELCDRWGTPFFFHQESAAKMGILSAGPDRKRGTADDVLLTP